MTRQSPAIDQLPSQAQATLCQLGDHLATARKRRKQSLSAWATRMQISVPTLLKMEKGDPSVGMGVYATAIWLVGGLPALAEVAAPKNDLAALEAEVQQARRRGQPKGTTHA